MKFRSLLLGTAAVFAIAGGAQAADLTTAAAVDYVKVCDAYGAGYYYIPGTDTCLRIGGYVQEDIWWYNKSKVGNIDGQTVTISSPDVPQTDTVDVSRDDYSASWEFKTEAGVNFTARTMSDIGPVVVFSDWRINSNNDTWSGYEKYAHPDTYYASIGPVLFGYTESLFDFGGGWTYDGGIREDLKTDQLRWSYMLGTWGIMLGLEDPRDRYGSGTDGGGHAKNATGDYPDIILALTGSAGGWSWQVAGAVTDRTSGTGWGVTAGFTGDLGGGFKLRAQGAWSSNAPTFAGGSNCTGACGDEGDWWSALVAGTVALSSNVSAAATLSYLGAPSGGEDQWQAEVGAYWAANSTSTIGLEFRYNGFSGGGTPDNWGIHARFESHFGG